MRQAYNVLEQLDGSRNELAPLSPPPRLDTKQNSDQEQNSRMKTVSKEMLARLKEIEKLASHGYQVKKIWDAIPGLVGSPGIDKSLLVLSPAGFSWIPFFCLRFAHKLKSGAISM